MPLPVRGRKLRQVQRGDTEEERDGRKGVGNKEGHHSEGLQRCHSGKLLPPVGARLTQ